MREVPGNIGSGCTHCLARSHGDNIVRAEVVCIDGDDHDSLDDKANDNITFGEDVAAFMWQIDSTQSLQSDGHEKPGTILQEHGSTKHMQLTCGSGEHTPVIAVHVFDVEMQQACVQ